MSLVTALVFFLLLKLSLSNDEKKSEKSYFIDWAARQSGEKCRHRCEKNVAYAESFCGAATSFMTAMGCALLDISEPVICGLLEGPSTGLHNLCGSGIFDKLCQKCDASYNILDVFFVATKLQKKISDEILAPLTNVTEDLQRFVQKTASSANLNSLSSRLSSDILLAKYEKTLMRLRFITRLFARVNLQAAEPSEDNLETLDMLDMIKANYVQTAIDTPYQEGVITILRTLHSLLMGETITIYGINQASSILTLSPALCQPANLLQLEEILLSLFFQTQYVYKDHPDLPSLTSWMTELRSQQMVKINSICIHQWDQVESFNNPNLNPKKYSFCITITKVFCLNALLHGILLFSGYFFSPHDSGFDNEEHSSNIVKDSTHKCQSKRPRQVVVFPIWHEITSVA